MENNYDQISFKYNETDKQTPSVRIMAVFLVLVFAFIPLAEIVNDLDYQFIESHLVSFCASDYPLEPLSFKEVR